MQFFLKYWFQSQKLLTEYSKAALHANNLFGNIKSFCFPCSSLLISSGLEKMMEK